MCSGLVVIHTAPAPRSGLAVQVCCATFNAQVFRQVTASLSEFPIAADVAIICTGRRSLKLTRSGYPHFHAIEQYGCEHRRETRPIPDCTTPRPEAYRCQALTGTSDRPLGYPLACARR